MCVGFACVTKKFPLSYLLVVLIKSFRESKDGFNNRATSKTFSKSSHQRCTIKIGVLKNFAKFTGSTCARTYFFNKVEGTSVFL